MTRKKFADLVRFYTSTDSTTFTDAEILLLANIYMLDIAEAIVEANEDFFITPATADLVADQREYSFPADMLLKMKYLEAKFSAGGDWIPLTELDLNDYNRATDETTITNYFANQPGQARYDIVRGSLYLYTGTITSVTGGLKLWFAAEPSVLSDVTDDVTDMSVAPSTVEHGFPKPFHELLARRLSMHYKSHVDRPIPLTEQELSYQNDLAMKLAKIKNPNLSRAVLRSTPDLGEDRFGNYGYNL